MGVVLGRKTFWKGFKAPSFAFLSGWRSELEVNVSRWRSFLAGNFSICVWTVTQVHLFTPSGVQGPRTEERGRQLKGYINMQSHGAENCWPGTTSRSCLYYKYALKGFTENIRSVLVLKWPLPFSNRLLALGWVAGMSLQLFLRAAWTVSM